MSDGPPRDQAVDGGALLHELDRRLARGVLDEDQRIGGQADLLVGLPQHPGDGRVGGDRSRRASEERGVARLQAQARRIGGHVGAVLVDDRHHAQRHPHPRDGQAVGPDPPVEHLAHRVGQRRHLPQAARHGLGAPRSGGGGRSPCRSRRRLGPGRRRPRWRPADRRCGRRGGRPRRGGRRPSGCSRPWPAAARPPWPDGRARGWSMRSRREAIGRHPPSRVARCPTSDSPPSMTSTPWGAPWRRRSTAIPCGDG